MVLLVYPDIVVAKTMTTRTDQAKKNRQITQRHGNTGS
jgi:hypothetical protein